MLYGRGHRYGTPQTGTAETIKAFTTDDLRAFYAASVPAGQRCADRGRRHHDRQGDAAARIELRRWKPPSSTPAPSEKLPAVEQPATRQIYIVDKPGAPQTQIRIGWIGVPRSTPDYFPLLVLNTLLGGSFSSRLNLNLREKHGYTYGASSSFDMRA